MSNLSTWQDILDLFYGVIGDEASVGTWVPVATAELFANQCLVEIGESCQLIEKSISTVTVAAAAEYTFNSTGSTTYGLVRIECDDEKLLATNKKQLFRWNRWWHNSTGSPKWYYRDGLNDFDEVGLPVSLWPTPAVSGVSLRAVLSVAPDAVSNAVPTDVVTVPLWSVPILLWGMLSMAYQSETRLQNLKAAQVFRRMYVDALDRLRARSVGRLPRSMSYGSKPVRGHAPSWKQMFPADGFEV